MGLTTATRSTLLRLRPPALPLSLLLLPTRELPQPLDQLVDLVVGLLLLPAADGLVLILELVEFELEQVCQVVGIGTTTTATLLLPTRRDVTFVGFLGLLEPEERFLFG